MNGPLGELAEAMRVGGTSVPHRTTVLTRWLRRIFTVIGGAVLFIFSPILLSPVLRVSARAPQRGPRSRLPWGSGSSVACDAPSNVAVEDPLMIAGATTATAMPACGEPLAVAITQVAAAASCDVASSEDRAAVAIGAAARSATLSAVASVDSCAAPLVAPGAELCIDRVGFDTPFPLIVELADLALSCGATTRATELARTALLFLDEVASEEVFSALRVLGFAMMQQGKVVAATAILDGAVETGIAIGATDGAAETLHYLGVCVLDLGDFAAAEARFCAAIALLKPTKSEFQATLYHDLAISLFHQGKRTAELNAVTALASRTDKNSAGAKADQALLRTIRAGRGPAS